MHFRRLHAYWMRRGTERGETPRILWILSTAWSLSLFRHFFGENFKWLSDVLVADSSGAQEVVWLFIAIRISEKWITNYRIYFLRRKRIVWQSEYLYGLSIQWLVYPVNKIVILNIFEILSGLYLRQISESNSRATQLEVLICRKTSKFYRIIQIFYTKEIIRKGLPEHINQFPLKQHIPLK